MKICSEDDCDRKVLAKGMCSMHYQRKYFRDNRERELKKLRDRRERMTVEQKEEFKAQKRLNSFARIHGLSKDAAIGVLRSKSDICEICRRPAEETSRRRICYDHSHATKEHRGWLCDNCNLGLGHFQDDPDCLRRAAAYLES